MIEESSVIPVIRSGYYSRLSVVWVWGELAFGTSFISEIVYSSKVAIDNKNLSSMFYYLQVLTRLMAEDVAVTYLYIILLCIDKINWTPGDRGNQSPTHSSPQQTLQKIITITTQLISYMIIIL